MKSDVTNLILTFALGVLLVIDVVFALQAINHTRELRSMNAKASQVQTSILEIQSIMKDVAAYNQRNPSPELTRLLQPVDAKPAAH